MTLAITEEVTGETAVLDIRGDVDVYTAPRLRETLLRYDSEGYSRYVLDLTGCAYLDATGLGVIIGALKRAGAQGGTITIACDSEDILRIFRTTGMTKVLAIYPARDEAVAAIAGDQP